ncbi:uncharacterized protein LOC121403841 [Drosophila obscura]|uniref:uncharacterized protein LOC121403841 n=1 Tax=Drosophila obscura TaxID=7282 RepID=UPI001BB2B635|nr:uncharacterized protein LOC121403841 [Drosophila obscura]
MGSRVFPARPLNLLHQVLAQTRDVAKRRDRRSAAGYGGPYFYNRHGKRTALTKKITEIRKPERKAKPLFDFEEFDEEKFFRKLDEQTEEPPSYTRLPEGDVLLRHIESVDGGEESDQVAEPVVYRKSKPKSKTRESLPEQERAEGRAKLRLSPTEFFEAPPAPKQTKRLSLGATLNSLLFPEPFSSKATISKTLPLPQEEPEEEVEPLAPRRRPSKMGHVANDFLQAQRELGKHFLSHIHKHEQQPLDEENAQESSLEAEPAKKPTKQDYFGAKKAPVPVPKPKRLLAQKGPDESITSWWDMPALRRRRALPFGRSDDEVRSNAIDKMDRDDMLPLGRYSFYEYKADQPVDEQSTEPPKESRIMRISKTRAPIGPSRKTSLSDTLVSTVKSKVSRFMHIVSRHMSEWYNTLTKHLDTETGSSPRPDVSDSGNAID